MGAKFAVEKERLKGGGETGGFLLTAAGFCGSKEVLFGAGLVPGSAWNFSKEKEVR